MLRKILYGLGVAVLVLAGVIVILPHLIAWDRIEALLSERAQTTIGRRVIIEGRTTLELFPRPTVIAEDVTLTNPSAARDATMIHAEAIHLEINPWQLLRGRWVFEKIVLNKPRINLQRFADGTANWSFVGVLDPADGTESDVEDVTGNGGSIGFRAFEIVDAHIAYRDLGSGLSQEFKSVNATVFADSLSGPFSADGSLVMRTIPWRFTLVMDALAEDRGVPLTVTLGAYGAAVEFGGVLAGYPDAPQLAGRISATAEDAIAFMIESISNVPEMGMAAGRQGNFEGVLRADEKGLAIEQLAGRIGTVEGSGSIDVIFDAVPRAHIALNVEDFDLDAFNLAAVAATREAEEEGNDDDATAVAEDRAVIDAPRAGPPPFSLPTGFTADLEIGLGTIVYGGEAVRDIRFAARLADAEIVFENLHAALPNATSLALDGRLSAQDGAPRLRGNMALQGSEIAALLDWAGLGLGAAELASHLAVDGPFLLTASADLRPGNYAFDAIDADIEGTNVTGSLTVAPGQRAEISTALTVSEADFGVVRLQPLELVADISVADLPMVIGQLLPAATPPPPGSPIAAAPAVAGRLDIAIRGDPERLQIDAIAEIFGGMVDSSWVVERLERQPIFDVSFNGTFVDAAHLLPAFGRDPTGIALDPLRLTGTISGAGDRSDLALTFTLGEGEGTIAGTMIDMTRLSGALKLTASHPDMGALIAMLLPAGTEPARKESARDLGAVDFEMDIEIDRPADAPPTVGLHNISGSARGAAIGGDIDLTLARAGGRPRLTAALETGAIAADWLALPAMIATPALGSVEAVDGPASDWSGRPLDLRWASVFDGTVDLTAGALTHGTLILENVALKLDLQDGRIEIEKLTGQLAGGAVDIGGFVAAPVDGSNTPSEVEITATLQAVDLAGLQGALGDDALGGGGILPLAVLLVPGAGFDIAGGVVDMDVELASAGSSQAALVGNLAGRVTYRFENLVLDGFSACAVAGILANVPVASSPTPAAQEESAITQIEPFTAQFSIADGTATFSAQEIEGDCTRTEIAGAVDLMMRQIDFLGQVAFPTVDGLPGMSFRQQGPFGDARPRLTNSDELETFFESRIGVVDPADVPSAAFRSLIDSLVR